MKFENIPTWQDWQRQSSSFFTRTSTDIANRANKAKLARIDELIKKYHQVLDMGKVNILMELKNAIADWAADKIDRDASTSRLKAMQALEEVVLRKLIQMENWSKHRYLKAVCIGYAINTGEYRSTKKPADETKRDRDEQADVARRVQILTKAIDQARIIYENYVLSQGISLDEDLKILKIFMAPEFFFRGPYGAYRDLMLLSEIMDRMSATTRQPLYDDWLFIHGTALFGTEKEVEKSPGKWSKDGTMLENYALIQKGGPMTNESQQYVAAKEFPSHIDFKHPTMGDLDWYTEDRPEAKIAGRNEHAIRPQGGRRDPVAGGGQTLQNTPPVSELVGGCIFTMDGITFGIEVCRDHHLRRLASSSNSKSALIQLIPSAGMSISREAIACQTGGIIFNVDGVTPHTMVQVNSTGGPTSVVGFKNGWGVGSINLYKPVNIPWPKAVRSDVARKLKVDRNVLSGIPV